MPARSAAGADASGSECIASARDLVEPDSGSVIAQDSFELAVREDGRVEEDGLAGLRLENHGLMSGESGGVGAVLRQVAVGGASLLWDSNVRLLALAAAAAAAAARGSGGSGLWLRCLERLTVGGGKRGSAGG